MTLDVSCRSMGLFLRQAEKEGIPLERLTEGTPHSPAFLRDKNQQMTWDDFSRVMANAGRLWTREQLVGMGADYLATSAMRHVLIIARLLYTPAEFYRSTLDTQRGAGNQVFRCIENHLEEPSPGMLRIDVRLPPGYTSCPEFFYVTHGNFIGMPRLLGLREARVWMEWTERGARYDVQLPRGGGTLASLRRAALWPFTARAAARELREAHVTLGERYRELEAAREALSRQTLALQTADLLGHELAAKTKLPEIYEALVNLLLSERFGYTAVALSIAEEPGSEPALVREAGSGKDACARRYTLQSGGDTVGVLEVWGPQPPEEHDLLSALSPWVAIAVTNGRSVALLQRQQEKLEQLVTERTAALQRTTAELESSLARALAAEREQARFFANASHEMRTPLTLMVSPLEALTLRQDLSPDAKAALRTSLASAYRLLKLVNDLLDLSKTDAGAMQLHSGAVDLSALLAEACRVWEVPLRERGIQLQSQLLDSAPLTADSERLEQVLHNVFANAAKHTPDGGSIRVECEASEHHFLLSISNTGMGIPEEDLPLLFERFAQGSRSQTRRFGSTGLGLPLVRELLLLHGGDVSAESGGGWTHFRIRLPKGGLDGARGRAEGTPKMSALERRQYTEMGRPQQEMQAPVRSPRSEAATAAESTRVRLQPQLLIAEDNGELRAFLERELGREFRLLFASDGEAALALTRERRPDLILSDYMMPKMDGLELCRSLKADPKTAWIPFVLLTARSDLGTKLTGFGSGADDFIIKPFHIEEVRARLATHLRMRQLMQELAHTEKLASLGTVVAGIAHELRNPLNGIVHALGPASELLAGTSPEVAELLGMAKTAAERAVALTGQLLEGTRAEPGAHHPCELADTIRLAVRLVSHLGKGARLETHLPEEDATVILGQPGALTQAWVNLIENALHAAGASGRVRVRMEQADSLVKVSISDNGPGIPPENLARLFEPFFTTKGPGEGTGLGLALARQTILLHGGRIVARSRPGEGAEFQVTLPRPPQTERH